jgi:hypothetical protein
MGQLEIILHKRYQYFVIPLTYVFISRWIWTYSPTPYTHTHFIIYTLDTLGLRVALFHLTLGIIMLFVLN